MLDMATPPALALAVLDCISAITGASDLCLVPVIVPKFLRRAGRRATATTRGGSPPDSHNYSSGMSVPAGQRRSVAPQQQVTSGRCALSPAIARGHPRAGHRKHYDELAEDPIADPE